MRQIIIYRYKCVFGYSQCSINIYHNKIIDYYLHFIFIYHRILNQVQISPKTLFSIAATAMSEKIYKESFVHIIVAIIRVFIIRPTPWAHKFTWSKSHLLPLTHGLLSLSRTATCFGAPIQVGTRQVTIACREERGIEASDIQKRIQLF